MTTSPSGPVGLFFGLFATEAMSFLATVPWALLRGAAAGAVFGLMAHAMTGGERDFVSLSRLAADHYDVLVPAAQAERARRLVAPPTT